MLRLALANVNGLSSKVRQITDFSTQRVIDIVCITESHLLSHIADSFVQIPGFTLHRNDVSGSVYKHGVCAYVRDQLAVTKVCSPFPNIITFCLPDFRVFIAVVYRPPSNTEVDNDQLVSYLSDFCADKEVIVLGDFNLPNLDWMCSDAPATCSTVERNFLNLFNVLGLTQWINQPTFPRSGNILDLILTTEPDRLGHVEVCPPLPGCDHCLAVCDYVFEPNDTLPISHPRPCRRAWSKGRFASMRQLLKDMDWDFEFAYRDCDECFVQFVKVLAELTDEFVPEQPSSPRTGSHFQTRPPTSLIHRRQRAWNNYKAVRQKLGRKAPTSVEAYGAFASVNKELRTFIVSSQSQYERDLLDRSRENPKLLHSYVRSKKVGCPAVGPLMLKTGEMSNDAQTMSEVFASSFVSVFSPNSPRNPAPHQTFDRTLNNIDFSAGDVLTALMTLDPHSAMGPDRLQPLVLKSCAAEVAYPLYLIFQKSLQEGKLPALWKLSIVKPIFKKGHRYDPLNYRPISLTSVVCKSMERIICTKLRNYLETNFLLTENQFGFRPGRSTMDQLLLVYNSVSLMMDAGHVVDIIFFDFSKAFDVVNHEIMLVKLRSLGLQGCLLDWLSSFLQGRLMQVCVKDCLSKPCAVESGVPQGSVLGPLLFLVYVNSVASQLKNDYKIFADDIKLYACVPHHPSSSSPSLATQHVQKDIDILHSTAASWGLKMNAKKCVALRFNGPSPNSDLPGYSLDGQQIPFSKSHLDLGVTVDCRLKFHEHVRSSVLKAGGLAHSLLKSTVCRSPEFMMFLLITHIRPLIEYCSCIWNTGYIEDLRLLENVQRRWTKRVSGLDTMHYSDRLRTLNLYSVQGRLLRSDLIQCWKIFHGKSCLVPIDVFNLPPQTRTRGHIHKIFPLFTRTDTRKRFFTVRCMPVWNSLPEEVVSAPNLAKFKEMLHLHLHDRLFDFA